MTGHPTAAPQPPPMLVAVDGGHIASHPAGGASKAEGATPLPRVTILQPAAPTSGTIEALALETFPGQYSRGKLNHREPLPYPLLDKVLAEAEKFAGPLWTEVDIAAEKADASAWRNCQLLLDEASIGNASRLLRRKLDAVAAQIAKGESPPPPAPIDESQLAQYRGVIRLAQSEISNRVHSRLLPKVQRVREAAITLALARAEIERRTAREDGFIFCASQTLRSLIFFAVRGWEDPVSNFQPGLYATLSPSHSFFSRTLWVASPQEAGLTDVERKAEMAKLDELVASSKKRLLDRQENEIAAKTAEHKAEVEKLSVLHDRLRAEASAAKPERLAVPVTRIIQ